MVAASADVADIADERLLAWQRVQPQPQGVAADVDAGDVALPKSDCDGLLETRKHEISYNVYTKHETIEVRLEIF
jgi:hypothetical protein